MIDEDLAAEMADVTWDLARGDAGVDAWSPPVPARRVEAPTTAEAARLAIREAVQAALREMGANQRPVGDLFTTEQAAIEADVKPKTIRAWVAAGLPAKRHGRRILITRQALDAWRTGEAPQVTSILAALTKAA